MVDWPRLGDLFISQNSRSVEGRTSKKRTREKKPNDDAKGLTSER